MSFYPPEVQARLESSKNTGALSDASARGRAVSFECGSFVAIELEAGPDSIKDARFSSNGCGFMIGAADVLCEKLNGNRLADLHGLRDDELHEYVISQLNGLPVERTQCLNVCIEALQSAFAGLRDRRVEEFRGEKALICTCFGVTEETIENTIAEHGLSNVDEVTDLCRAGGGCGSCRMLIEEMLDTATHAGDML
jgi:NifU-like protein